MTNPTDSPSGAAPATERLLRRAVAEGINGRLGAGALITEDSPRMDDIMRGLGPVLASVAANAAGYVRGEVLAALYADLTASADAQSRTAIAAFEVYQADLHEGVIYAGNPDREKYLTAHAVAVGLRTAADKVGAFLRVTGATEASSGGEPSS